MEEENDLIVADVPETSNEIEEVEINTSQDLEQPQNSAMSDEEINKLVEERANVLTEERIKDRLARDRASRERKQAQEMAKYRQLENVIKAGLGVDNLDDAINQTSNYYKEQGISIPDFKDTRTEWEENVLAESYAKQVIDLGRERMQEEVDAISAIPYNKRTAQEKKIFNLVGTELKNLNNIDEMKSKGYNTDILQAKEFGDFKKKFDSNVSISEIYEMYNKINGVTAEQPRSPGSAKSTSQVKQIKDYYSPEEFDKLTDEELANPKVMEIVDKSRLQWFKNLK